MALRNAKLVAFAGTHASGKTTLIYAIAALLRRQGVHVLLHIEPGTWDAEMADAMDGFCRAWGQVYDAIFFCQDHHNTGQRGGKYRARVSDLQVQADGLVRAEYARLGQPIIEILRALDVDERARWVVAQMKKVGLIEEEYYR